MLDILLVIIALLMGGVCAAVGSRQAFGGSRWFRAGMLAFQQAFAACSFRLGAVPGSWFGCRRAAVAAMLARPAPQRAACYLPDRYSGQA